MTIPRTVIADSLTNWAAMLHDAAVQQDWAMVEHCRLNLLNCAGLLLAVRTPDTDTSGEER